MEEELNEYFSPENIRNINSSRMPTDILIAIAAKNLALARRTIKKMRKNRVNLNRKLGHTGQTLSDVVRKEIKNSTNPDKESVLEEILTLLKPPTKGGNRTRSKATLRKSRTKSKR